MKDELITFETAKLTKEKGFEELCFYFYNSIGKLIEPYEENGSSTDTDFRVDLTDLLENNNYKHLNNYSAPTQSLLQRWLREVHNINVEILVIKSIDLNVKYVGLVSFIEDNVWKRISLNKEFDTFEEITEEGLKEGLKLIK